jgi:hypothetical protein
MSESQPQSFDLQQCIQNCRDTQRTCMLTLTHLLAKGVAGREAHARALMDSAEICQTAANFMLRGSESVPYACAVCAQVCETCAAACRVCDDDQLKLSAEICQRCADSCHYIAEQAQ